MVEKENVLSPIQVNRLCSGSPSLTFLTRETRPQVISILSENPELPLEVVAKFVNKTLNVSLFRCIRLSPSSLMCMF